MATYKVIQDIEAEDKFVGPLTLKQFIFACITVVCGYLSFFLLTKHLWYISVVFLPFIFLFGFLAFPWGRDQPTEVWLLAKIRFFFKPHLRTWDQSGVQELVTITAPKRSPDQFISDNLSQTEVKSRLKALADTIDSRGWAVKNAPMQPAFGAGAPGSDRLLDISSIPAPVVSSDVGADEDILDEANNPVAQHLNEMITSSTKSHRQETLAKMQKIRETLSVKAKKEANSFQLSAQSPQPGVATPRDLWFMNQGASAKPAPSGYATFGAQTVSQQDPGMPVATNTPLTEEEKKLLKHVHEEEQKQESANYGHMRVVKPLKAQSTEPRVQSTGLGAKDSKLSAQSSQLGAKAPPDPAILELAHNDDLNVATIARQMQKDKGNEPPDEVVVSLH